MIKKILKSDPNNWKISVSWPIALLLVGLLTTTITFYILYRNTASEVVDLKSQVATLTNTTITQGATLVATQGIVNQAFTQFTEYSPALFDSRIARCETALGLSHVITPTVVFKNNTPPK